eukprot:8729572-Pyramimonas_sp.AAC.1
MAKNAEKRYNLWCDAGSPPASACRMPGEPEDDRILYHPYRNVTQRFLNDSRFHHQVTGAREAAGRMDRGTRQERGLVTIAIARGGGTYNKTTQ